MPRKAKRQGKPEEEHTLIMIRVEGYEAHVDAGINSAVYAPQYAWDLDDDDPLYKFTSRLQITGTSLYPEKRAGETYELIVYGDDARSRQLDTKLKDTQARDKHGSPQYRSYRGREIPVYGAPKGMGLLDKIRGEPRWTAWLHVMPGFMNDALVLLGQKRDLFLTIHECKIERARWVRRVTLQTHDPQEE